MIQKFLNHPIFLGTLYNRYKTIGGPETTNILRKYDNYLQSYLRWILVRLVLDNDLKFANGQRMIHFTDASKKYKIRLTFLKNEIWGDRRLI